MAEQFITAKEVGAALQELREIRHDYRNLKMVVNALGDEQDKLRVSHARLDTKLKGFVAALAVLIPILVWIAERFFPSAPL